ncbi:MAG: 1-acyl-sn-glycerol-3-phosphate acyltransferase [Firmicutes bacterium]|nr:1-acyl-sn-glycerol-3-phosphate acyltransferase [Bacillota bacterium]MBQ7241564.1 1-acyl-sn-glycerol-3-phosphate acyltransferase [Bacillota bacterium]MBR0105502.1 1-acyl-sn-glycerol-3-phosphate acyltransferase [Bacillota bacterium]MBR2593897.1 1-acyl-sn-glycerol-3-phosphate acyltransferase [Bacillota bacterium]
MFYKFTKVVTTIFYAIFFRVKVYGKENIPKDSGALLCCNHQSYHDPVIMATYATRVVHYMAKRSLFDVRGLNIIIRWLYAFPVDRDKTDLEAVRTTIKLLKSGEIVGIFAEGRRVKQGEDHDAKSGTVLFAVKAGVPVIPVAISSTFKFFSKITVKYGEPIYFEELKGRVLNSETLAEGIAIVMEKIDELKASIE